MSKLHRAVPILASLKGYTRATFRDDLTAGLTTAIMLIPQAMAYAMLAGLDPIIGLYASILPLVAYAVFGTSRQLAVGPVAMVSLLVASGVGALANPGTPEYLSYAILLSLMVGIMQVGMGLARLGFLVDFLSHPVVAGFTSAAAIVIGASQLKHLLGVDLPRSHHVHEIFHHAILEAGHTHLPTFAIGIGSLVSLVLLKRWNPRFPRFLAVVVIGTLAVWGLDLQAAGVAIVGDVPAGLPGLTLPTFDLSAARDLLPIALTISLVGFMESIAVAKAFAREGGYELDADAELRGLGAANLVGAFTSAYPVTGGFSRTAVNAQAGARTGVAAILTAAFVALTLLFLTPSFYYLPMAVLAAIILSAVAGLIDFAEARHLWKVSRPDLAMMGLTFAATLGLGIEEGIAIGVFASLAWFMRKVQRPHVALLGQVEGTQAYRKLERNPTARPIPGALILRMDAPLFFANATFLKNTLRDLEAARTEPLRAVILDCTGIGQVDASGATALDDLVDDYRQRGVAIYLAGVHEPVQALLDRAHLPDRCGEAAFTLSVHEAVQRAGRAGDCGCVDGAATEGGEEGPESPTEDEPRTDALAS